MTEIEDEKKLKNFLSVFTKSAYREILSILKRDQERYADEQVKKAIEQIEKSLPSDDELSDVFKYALEKNAAKYQRNKTQAVINKLKKG